ncbi:MAG: shikimate kinase AroL [Desulfovibrionaceae bacterium]|nr:shikimate kinase AroL [Desulfovibrionaceae bacterium]
MHMIFLVGPRAAGKTTVGKALAAGLHLPFVDTDASLTAFLGREVADSVAQEGWPAFRRHESATLRREIESHASTGAVIATGGGMVLAPRNRSCMRKAGTVFCLMARAGVLAARLQAEPLAGQRPSLTGRDVAEEMRHVLQQRRTCYRKAAHYTLKATHSTEKVCREIMRLLRLRQPA